MSAWLGIISNECLEILEHPFYLLNGYAKVVSIFFSVSK